MKENYFKIPEAETGYLPILKAFRTEIPLATNKHYPNLESKVEGYISLDIKSRLPIFGLPSFLPSDAYALNSGGRGILLSDGKSHFRLKGCDLDGSITEAVAKSSKNHMPDINKAYSKITALDFGKKPLDSGETFFLPTYDGKPFSFFTKESVEREEYASNVLAEGFEERGFNKLYTTEAIITYPQIQWNGEPCSTLVFRLPTLESDLRFEEIYRHSTLHLKFASPKELAEIKDDLGDFLKKLTTWHGFVTALMSDNSLVPTSDSHQYQNYVICHVTDSEIGASRVDHTSTVVDENASLEYKNWMKEDLPFFANLHIFLLHALELAKNNYPINEKRYTGYFDRAYKWHDSFSLDRDSDMGLYLNGLEQSFNLGFEKREPVPIPEKELINLFEKISSIKIDEERFRIQQETYHQLLQDIFSSQSFP